MIELFHIPNLGPVAMSIPNPSILGDKLESAVQTELDETWCPKCKEWVRREFLSNDPEENNDTVCPMCGS